MVNWVLWDEKSLRRSSGDQGTAGALDGSTSLTRLSVAVFSGFFSRLLKNSSQSCFQVISRVALSSSVARRASLSTPPKMVSRIKRAAGSSTRCQALALRLMSVAAISALVSFSTASGASLEGPPKVLLSFSWSRPKLAEPKPAKSSRWSSFSFFVLASLSSAAAGKNFLALSILIILFAVCPSLSPDVPRVSKISTPVMPDQFSGVASEGVIEEGFE
mmetsp:Transcript_24663/g.64895  ORF Transcript_24663/g.64895 Transcript_24663/m.64895 type:complete len:218 (-) Transcript_24663:910-1563(-)